MRVSNCSLQHLLLAPPCYGILVISSVFFCLLAPWNCQSNYHCSSFLYHLSSLPSLSLLNRALVWFGLVLEGKQTNISTWIVSREKPDLCKELIPAHLGGYPFYKTLECILRWLNVRPSSKHACSICLLMGCGPVLLRLIAGEINTKHVIIQIFN